MGRARKAKVQRQDVPPVLDTTYVPIVSAKKENPFDFVVLNPGIVGVWTHYYLERTIPCWGRHSGCLCRSLHLAKRWKGYLGCYWPMVGKNVLAEVTIEAYRNNPGLFKDHGNMRGLKVQLYRLRHSDKAPVRIFLTGRVPGEELALMAPPLDVMRSLYAVWGYNPSEEVKKAVAAMVAESLPDR